MIPATILFSVPNSGAPAMPGGLGVLAVAIASPHRRDLVLLVDLQAANKGASVTNAMEACIAYVVSRLSATWPHFDPRHTDWVQLDSDGWFDLVRPRWGNKAIRTTQRLTFAPDSVPLIRWEPIRGELEESRTLRAFLEIFDDIGVAALAEVQHFVDEYGLAVRARQTHDAAVE